MKKSKLSASLPNTSLEKLSPAERYQRFQARKAKQSITPIIDDFLANLPFYPDDFQLDALAALNRGNSVLVCAPTGSGKTLVGQWAAFDAQNLGKRCFYTTPIKALSNQKYREFCELFGSAQVGLLTGDNSINGSAPVVVMTTEVLRNMLYQESPNLNNLKYVVFDEVHYLSTPDRGPVWEETILNLNPQIQLICLSATVANPHNFADWLSTVHHHTEVIVHSERPVPLGAKAVVGQNLYDLLASNKTEKIPNSYSSSLSPALISRLEELTKTSAFNTDNRSKAYKKGRRLGNFGARKSPHNASVLTNSPHVEKVLLALQQAKILPAIYFLFSRGGCEEAAINCQAFLRNHTEYALVTPEEQTRIEEFALQFLAAIPDSDYHAFKIDNFIHMLASGVATHHAGMLPILKELVEELFSRGILKLIFATETLALGVNMPAKAVVLDQLVKWNGHQQVPIESGQFSQLTGRAGRRGIDKVGFAVAVVNRLLDPYDFAALYRSDSFSMNSAFKPTYEMSVALLARRSYKHSLQLMQRSYAQYQISKRAARIGVKISQLEQQKNRAKTALTESFNVACCCPDLAGFTKYLQALEAQKPHLFSLSQSTLNSKSSPAAVHAKLPKNASMQEIMRLKPGDIVVIRSQRGQIVGCFLKHHWKGGRRPFLQLLTPKGRFKIAATNEADLHIIKIGRVRIPRSTTDATALPLKTLERLSKSVNSAYGAFLSQPQSFPTPAQTDDFKTAEADLNVPYHESALGLKKHASHSCPQLGKHLENWRLIKQLELKINALNRELGHMHNSLARDFSAVCEVLQEFNFLKSTTSVEDTESENSNSSISAITETGSLLTYLHTENSLLLVKSFAFSSWQKLSPAALSAILAAVIYQTRLNYWHPQDLDTYCNTQTSGSSRRKDARQLAKAFKDSTRLAEQVIKSEQRRGINYTFSPCEHVLAGVHRWAEGGSFKEVSELLDLSPGDVVRLLKQVIDVLRQITNIKIEDLNNSKLSEHLSNLQICAKTAVKLIKRGVVAWEQQ